MASSCLRNLLKIEDDFSLRKFFPLVFASGYVGIRLMQRYGQINIYRLVRAGAANINMAAENAKSTGIKMS